jgi:hypothetical protein
MIEWLCQFSLTELSGLLSTLPCDPARMAGNIIQVELPYSLRGVSESMKNSGSYGTVIICLLIGLLLLVGICLLLSWRKNRKDQAARDVNDPDKLFASLLGQLHLPESDKALIREMAAEARLRHPAVCLLSPGLLQWTSRLWQTEKCPKEINSHKLARLNEISVALYDHVIPSAPAPPDKFMV